MRENHRKNGVYLQNYSYLNYHLLQISKHGTLSNPRQLFLYSVIW